MSYAVPALILFFLLYALRKGGDLYGAFTRGAFTALPLMGKVLPCMAAMLAAVEALRASGILDGLYGLLRPLCERLGMPEALLPLFLLRPFSGSAGMALLSDVYQSCGVDSLEGFAASLMMGSSETIFYILALYLGGVGVKKSRHLLPAALFGALVGAAGSLHLARVFF